VVWVADDAEFRVCATADVPDGEARRFDRDGLRLCVVHLGDDWYAIGDECTHADYSLSEGTIWPDEREIECPKHGSAFSLETGDPQTLPAVVPVPTFDVRVEGDDVVVVRKAAS
jgi:3-phenylpropionate/trans-cinnamate dioxygenase ferredoxin component